MKINRLRIILWLMLLVINIGAVNAADSFATARLREIVEQLPAVNTASLYAGNTYVFDYQKNKVAIRVNEWNEVEHVGYVLFADEVRENNFVPVCDFVERYFLELSLLPPSSVSQRLKLDDVVFENGQLGDFLAVGKRADVTMQMMEFKSYRIVWTVKGESMAMIFPMDYQLISGCDIIELEKNYIRDITRYRKKSSAAVAPDVPADYDKAYFMKSKGTYMAETVSHDLFFQKNGGKWEMVCDPQKPEWSAYNLMLSPSSVGEDDTNLMLSLELDRYGYESTSFDFPLSRWVAFCEEKEGTPYFIVKEIGNVSVKGTVYVPSERGGYCHMLSVEIPMDSIEKRKGTVKGRLYVYVPLHNVVDDFFKTKN